MINCSNCGKENQDHYKFCLGCGARLAGAAAPRSAAPAPAAVIPAAPKGGTVVSPGQSASAPVVTPVSAPKGGTVVSPGQSAPSVPSVTPMAPKGGTVVTPGQKPTSGPAVAPSVGPVSAPRGGTVVAPSLGQAPVASVQPPQVTPMVAPPRGGTAIGASQNNAPPLVTATSAGIEPGSSRQGGTVGPGSPRAPVQPAASQLDVTNAVRVAPPQAAPSEPAPGCSSCGMVNPPGFAFCGRCGNRLGAAAPVAAAPVAAAPVAAAPAPAPVPAPRPGLRASLHLLREDGSEGGTLHLEDGPVPFGRDYGAPFDGDLYLNPQHCAFTVTPDGVRVDDLTQTNGVFRKIEGTIELQHGDTFRVGQELLYYEDLPEPEVLADGTERMGSPNPGYWGRISVLVETGRACEAVAIVGTEFQIGRERGDLTFPTDGYVSSQHCRVVADDSGVYLEDRGSSNGTYLRVRSGTVVPYGSLVLIGQQLFHIKPA